MVKIIIVLSYIIASTGVTGVISKTLPKEYPSMVDCAKYLSSTKGGISVGLAAKKFAKPLKPQGAYVASITVGCK